MAIRGLGLGSAPRVRFRKTATASRLRRRGDMGLKISRSAQCASVIALHCSGAGAGQWRRLGDALGTGCELIAPEHYGCESVGPWTGEHAFTLADEAARTIALIDGTDCKVHLVRHAYGGG